jgi:drug/metabolite transporter (DMT)-like permease
MVIGVLFLKESLTMPEWLGVILGLITPLLLITKSEHHRQNHLKKGLLLMLLSALMAALAAAVNKYGADLFSSILILAALIYVFSALFGMLLTLIHGNNSKHGKHSTNAPVVFCFVMGALGYLSFATIMIAFSLGGLLSVVYTINSMYILVPIVLSIIYYKEHWNLQKVLAIAASLLALFFMV